MGWGTDFKTNVYLSRQIFKTEGELDYAIKEAEEAIQTNRELLLMMSMANPKDLIEEDEDALYATRNRVNDLINDLLEQCDKLTLLQLYFSAIQDGTAKFTDNEMEKDRT